MIVVHMTLNASLGRTGAPGSVPGAISSLCSVCERTPQGNTANSTTHQVMK